MRTFSMMQSRWGKAAFGVFLFAMLMLARDTLLTSALMGFAKAQLFMLGILGAFGLGFLAANRRQLLQILLDRRVLAMGVTAVLILLPMLLKQDWQMMYFSILLCPLTAIFLTYFTDVRQTAKYYVVIFVVLCIHSLLSLCVLKYLVLARKMDAPIFYNSAGWDFYNFGFSYVVTWPEWHRNFGIFREPGVYQFFIILALYLNNYKVDWKQPGLLWLVNGVLAVTMLSTFAVGGLIELGLFVLFLYVDKKWYKTTLGKVLGIGAAALVAVAVTIIVIQVRKPGSEGTIWYIFTDLYLRLFTQSDSLVDRISAIGTNMQLLLRNPILGDTVASVLHGTNHNTSSTLILYAVLGVLGGSLNVAAWVSLAWEKGRSILGNLVLLLILFMSFNTQNLVADVFFWLFPAMALAERTLPRLDLHGRKL